MAGELTAECSLRAVEAKLALPLDDAPVTVLFGPSGAGKSTLLRMLAGLEQPASGRIAFRGTVWFDRARSLFVPPQERRAGFLFQDYALFPHLSVLENVSHGASRAHALKMLERFGLSEFRDRKPRTLSGGEQQRVALARALAADPALLLLDEPLSALDQATRVRTRSALRRVLVESGIPSIVVTHDRAEAIALGDRMAVMVAGRVRQMGPVREVFRKPVDARVAESVGVENVLPAAIVSRGAGLMSLRVGEARIDCIDGGEAAPLTVCIRAEEIALARTGTQESSARNRVRGVVTAMAIEGPLARVELDCGFPLVAVITAQSAAELGLRPGETVAAILKTTSVHVTS